MNSLQIVSLTYWKQCWCWCYQYLQCCEFLTNCIFDILKTVDSVDYFTFHSCEFLTNCIFDILKTVRTWEILFPQGCEFLTNCIFDILKTVKCGMYSIGIMLWIPYKLYLWHIENSLYEFSHKCHHVVNSLQIVSLTYWKQCAVWKPLLVLWLWIPYKLYLWHIENSNKLTIKRWLVLWIPYKLYLWHIENSLFVLIELVVGVVNSLQIVSLTYWKQLICN